MYASANADTNTTSLENANSWSSNLDPLSLSLAYYGLSSYLWISFLNLPVRLYTCFLLPLSVCRHAESENGRQREIRTQFTDCGFTLRVPVGNILQPSRPGEWVSKLSSFTSKPVPVTVISGNSRKPRGHVPVRPVPSVPSRNPLMTHLVNAGRVR